MVTRPMPTFSFLVKVVLARTVGGAVLGAYNPQGWIGESFGSSSTLVNPS